MPIYLQWKTEGCFIQTMISARWRVRWPRTLKLCGVPTGALAAGGNGADYGADNEGEQVLTSPAMPSKLPSLIELLTSCTPEEYKPAVAHAVFPSLATHLYKTRFKYIDNVEHEATLMCLLGRLPSVFTDDELAALLRSMGKETSPIVAIRNWLHRGYIEKLGDKNNSYKKKEE